MQKWKYFIHVGGVALSSSLLFIKSSCYPLITSELDSLVKEYFGNMCNVISYDVSQIELPLNQVESTTTSWDTSLSASGTTTTVVPSPSPEIPPDNI
jgi:hypothetical protein